MNKDKEIQKINRCISDLVYDKVALKKAYNYYHCKRDAEQFKHIEDNYGIGTPTSVGFTPLIKKHIDVLVGEYLELDPDLQVSCKDEHTVTDILRDKQLKINAEVYKKFKSKLENAILKVFLDGKETTSDPFFEKELEQLKKDLSKSYVSEYEKAAQNILNYIKNSRDIDLKNNMRDLLTDLLIGGMCYYRTKPSNSKTNLKFEVLNPVDTFVERNFNEFYLNKSPRAVVRRWLTREQILAEFGDELSKEAKDKLENDTYKDQNSDNYIRSAYISAADISTPRVEKSLLGGMEANRRSSISGNTVSNSTNLFPVYECEWIEWDGDRQTRHEGVRINGEIYITRGESEYITRSVSNPKECTLSLNGIFFEDKNGDPFSIVLNTMDLQDWLI